VADLKTIAEQVAAGAAFLDEHDPGWWRAGVERAIDLETLDLAGDGKCVLGQRCPLEMLAGSEHDSGYLAFAGALSGIHGESPAAADAVNDWAAALGFQWDGSPDSAYAALTAEWKRVIAARRAEAARPGVG
jgi:hypothetical protein